MSKNVLADREGVRAAERFGILPFGRGGRSRKLGVESGGATATLTRAPAAADSFLFIDDSPAECAKVLSALPKIAVLRRPPERVQSLLQATWPLDVKNSVGLGEVRTKLYQDEEKRSAALRTSPSFVEYVRSLDLRVQISPAMVTDEGRVFELTQRTNQFNTRGGRPSASTIHEAICANMVLAVRAADRFGDYGLCGVIILSPSAKTLRIERLLLSCRVLGRGVEEEVFDRIVAHARCENFSAIEITASETQRNQPARNFLDRLTACFGFHHDETYRFVLAGLGACPRQLGANMEPPAQRDAAEAIDWNTVAELTRDSTALAAWLGLEVGMSRVGEGVLACGLRGVGSTRARRR